MAELEDLERRLLAMEERLGMLSPPPFDRMSSTDLRIDSLLNLVQAIGLTQGTHSRQLTEMQTGVAELKAGQKTIVEMLTTIISGSSDG